MSEQNTPKPEPKFAKLDAKIVKAVEKHSPSTVAELIEKSSFTADEKKVLGWRVMMLTKQERIAPGLWVPKTAKAKPAVAAEPDEMAPTSPPAS
jgi:hypothetical protein